MDVLAGLNPEQRRAAEAVRGPVCILAGAGSGKTTTITHRIANQVATGAFRAAEILAVTFTDKAAGEMRARLAALGADGVRASTFHSAALGQLRRLGDPPQRILASKALTLRRIANTLPKPWKFRTAVDLATEIEWAKNRRITPEAYRAAVDEHEPPIPPDLMWRVYSTYEQRKQAAGWVDFEDLLELTIRLFDDDPNALADVRSRFRAFTVDEYQDVNVLQQTLLERWLGESDEFCGVGDDYQSIYSFTGAGPEHLLAMRQRYPHATVVRLEENYRSTPQVLGLANRLVPKLGGAPKTLRATRPGGAEPTLEAFAVAETEAAWIVDRVKALREEGVAYEEMAVLSRTNARLADFEEVFHEAQIPFQGSALLERDAARQLLKRLRASEATAVAPLVRALAEDAGWLERSPEKLGERELVRQNDLGRFVVLAREFDDGVRTAREFVADLERRFGSDGPERRGVHLLTLHGAKGLEFEAVFLPHVEEKELPIKLAKHDHEIAEERRLFYVGMTRAKGYLAITWSRRPSRFLEELGVTTRIAKREHTPNDDPVFAALRAWRLQRARSDDVPPYVVFHDRTLAEIATRSPRTVGELAHIAGIGPAKLERYADDVLRVLAERREQEVEHERGVAPHPRAVVARPLP